MPSSLYSTIAQAAVLGGVLINSNCCHEIKIKNVASNFFVRENSCNSRLRFWVFGIIRRVAA